MLQAWLHLQFMQNILQKIFRFSFQKRNIVPKNEVLRQKAAGYFLVNPFTHNVEKCSNIL